MIRFHSAEFKDIGCTRLVFFRRDLPAARALLFMPIMAKI
jgi:hypothetical protein